MLCAMISPPAGRMAERVGNGPLLTVGGLCGAGGLLCHLFWTGLEPDFFKGVLLPGLLIGIAAGLGFAQIIGTTMKDVPRDQFAMAGAGRTTIFQLSLALGVALAFTIIGNPDRSSNEVLDGLQITWLMGIGCYLVQTILFASFSFVEKSTHNGR